MKLLVIAWLVWALVSPVGSQPADLDIGEIHYFGQSSIDMEKIRATLPVRVGDVIPLTNWPERAAAIRESVRDVAGSPATAVEPVCCNPNSKSILYIGLPGKSSHRMSRLPEPGGPERLTPAAIALHDEMSRRWMAAVQRGDSAEDTARGYSLMKAPEVREVQLKLRELAMTNVDHLIKVLEGSSDAGHRRAACAILGYAEPGPAMLEGLTRAIRDPDAHVRNNAVRALGVLASARPDLARSLDPAPFFEMLGSTDWTDRNKSVFLLATIAPSRDASFLEALRDQALEPLTEISLWDEAHASGAKDLLERISRLDDTQLAH